MSMGKRARKSGDEQDTFSSYWRSRYVYLQRAGATSKIKKRARRRERHEARAALEKDGE